MIALPNVILMNCYSLVVAIVATLMFIAFIVADISIELLAETTRSKIVMAARFSQARLLGHRSSSCRLVGEQSLDATLSPWRLACGALPSIPRRCFCLVGGA